MKLYILIFFTLLISGCGSKSKVFNLIKQNQQQYKELKKSKKLLLESAVIYVEQKSKSNFLVTINSRDREIGLFLTDCKINNKNASIVKASSNNITSIDWLNSYEVMAEFNNKKTTTLMCALNNGDKFRVTF